MQLQRSLFCGKFPTQIVFFYFLLGLVLAQHQHKIIFLLSLALCITPKKKQNYIHTFILFLENLHYRREKRSATERTERTDGKIK